MPQKNPPGCMSREGRTFLSHSATMAVVRKETILLHHSHSEPSCTDRNLVFMSCRTPRPASVHGIFLRVGRREERGKKPTKKKSVQFERHRGLPGPLQLDPAAVHCFSGHVAGHSWHSRNVPSSSCRQQSPPQRLERFWKSIYRH